MLISGIPHSQFDLCLWSCPLSSSNVPSHTKCRSENVYPRLGKKFYFLWPKISVRFPRQSNFSNFMLPNVGWLYFEIILFGWGWGYCLGCNCLTNGHKVLVFLQVSLKSLNMLKKSSHNEFYYCKSIRCFSNC